MEVILFTLGVLLLLALCWRFNFFNFYALIFLAPFLGLVVDFSKYTFAQKIPGLSGIQAPLADILALIVFLILILKVWQQSQRNPFLPWLVALEETGLKFFLPFLVIGLISLFNVTTEQLGGSFKYLLRPIFFFYLIWIVLPHFIITTKEILQKTIRVLFSAGLLAALWGVISTFLKSGGNLWKRITPGEMFNLAPLTYNHNILAEVLVLAAPLAFYLFLKSQKSSNPLREKILFLFFIFITLTALLTFSRAAWLSLIFEVIIYLLLQRQKATPVPSQATPQQLWWKKMGILFVFLLPVIIYMTAFSFSSVVKSSTTTRLDMTGIAWVYFSAHPLIGNGVGTFTQLIGDTRLFTVEYGDPLDSHGVIQKLLAETGLLGLIAFFIYVGWVITQLYNSASRAEKDKDLKILLLISFLGCLVFQLFNTSYYNQHLWLIAGIGLAAKKVLPNNYL